MNDKAIAIREETTIDRRVDRLAFEPADWNDAMRMGEQIVRSGLAPSGVDTPQKAFAIIVQGRELGLSVMQSLRGIHVVEGRPAISAALMVALVMESGKAEFFELLESSATKATYETKRRGSRNPTRLSWSIQDAERAGLTGRANWRKHPADMLRARCSSALVRAVYPDVIFGLYSPDEISSGAVAEAPEAAPVGPTMTVQQVIEVDVTDPAPSAASVEARVTAARDRLRAFAGLLGAEACRNVIGRSTQGMSVDELEASVAKIEEAQTKAVQTKRVVEDALGAAVEAKIGAEPKHEKPPLRVVEPEKPAPKQQGRARKVPVDTNPDRPSDSEWGEFWARVREIDSAQGSAMTQQEHSDEIVRAFALATLHDTQRTHLRKYLGFLDAGEALEVSPEETAARDAFMASRASAGADADVPW